MRIVSGGQTGVDRAALDVALELQLDCGGWCPRGRLAEDGRISDRYPLQETPSANYAVRTRWNVRDSDATLILTWGELSGGTLLTYTIANKMKKPHHLVDLLGEKNSVLTLKQMQEQVQEWLSREKIKTLNVAGPRESSDHGKIYAEAYAFLKKIAWVHI